MKDNHKYIIAGREVIITEQERMEILAGKKSFLLYTDKLELIDVLDSLEEKGLLLEAIYRAQTGQELPNLANHKYVAAIFNQLSNVWAEDDYKYVKTTLKNRQNFRRRAEPEVMARNTDESIQEPKVYDDVTDDDNDDEMELPF